MSYEVWNAYTQYQINDVVQYGFYAYRAIQASVNIVPTNTSYWTASSSSIVVNTSALSSTLAINGFDGGGNLNPQPNPNVLFGAGLTFNLNQTDPNTGLKLRDYQRILVSANASVDTNDAGNNSVCYISWATDAAILNTQGNIGQPVFQPARAGGDDISTYRYLNGTQVLSKNQDYDSTSTYLYVWFSKDPAYPNSRLGWWKLDVSVSPAL